MVLDNPDPYIAVIGMACRFPGANTPEEFWRLLRTGTEAITAVTADDLAAAGLDPGLLARPGYVPVTSALDGIDLFDAGFFGFTPREAALLDPQQRVFLECVWEALESAGHPPRGTDADVGVYCGSNLPTYLMHNLAAGSGPLVPGSDAFDLLIHNDKDYLATRTAYRLGLTGPAVTVQTACSTSLVAVHLASQSLLDGECDMAVAGGVCIRVPQRTGYVYRDGLVFSRDGHCRPFDADASGTVFGNGAGAVVLKRLGDALADGDRVEAVILGSAINNDGSAKVGYTAPSISGQTQVITAALDIADVDADTVTAVEAHGTGTPLGDPIEIAALTRAFREHTERSEYCTVSSVKSNLGHLDTAAGVAGLIKAVLQLRHRELVPNVHYQRPNPHIDFAATPFRVAVETAAWNPEGPRRIGVSSFGIGGTNAHVVLQEAPTAPVRTASGSPQIIAVSARTRTALAEAGRRLAAALETANAEDLPDIAHTLSTGRTAFRYRRALVGSDPRAVAERLAAPDAAAGGADSGTAPPRVVFLFPGQGSQYVGMARGLYEAETVFRDEVDACARVLQDPLGLDLRDLLYRGDSADITATAIAQPALFVVEYALTRLLASWGVVPDAMVGHSVGEFVAACVAGVMARDDALRLIALRGRLMQEQPAGSLLSVAAPAQDLLPLPGTLSLAAVNAPGLCVVSGPEAEVDAFAEQLSARGLAHRRLHTSHAFHSAMMDPAVDPFVEALRAVDLSAPRIPIASNTTGSPLTDAEAVDPGYWGRHLRLPVRFADGLSHVTADAGRCLLLEVGPGDVLTKLARQNVDRSAGHVLVSTLRAAGAGADSGDGGDSGASTASGNNTTDADNTAEADTASTARDGSVGDDVTTVLEAVAKAWTSGVAITAPEALKQNARLTPLPTYPFQRKRYWVTPAGAAPVAADVNARLDVPAAEPESAHAAEEARAGLSTEYTAPRTDLETRAVRIWQEFLGIAPIGVHDDFFELGGHSLTASELAPRMSADLGLDINLRLLLRHPTVADLLAHAGQADDEARPELPALVPDPARRHEPFPLTEMQQAQWLGRSAVFEVGNVAAHVYLETEGRGLDPDRLARAWQHLVGRHDMLRVVIQPDGTQRTLPGPLAYRPEVLDLRTESPETAEARMAEVRSRMRAQVRPAGVWPLWELRFVLLPGDVVRTQLSFDLLVADVSGLFFQLLPQWRRCYLDDAGPEPCELTFRDYVLAEAALHETPVYQRSLDYWRERVATLPPAPQLPVRRSPAEVEHPEFERHSARFDKEIWTRIKAVASEHGVTPAVTLVSAYAAVMAAWSRSRRFTLNLTAVNRLPLHPDVGRVLGEFASFNLLEVDASAAGDFLGLVRQLQERSWTDLEHRQVSGVRVLRELARRRGGVQEAMMPVVFTGALTHDADGEGLSWLGDLVDAISQTPQVTLDCFVTEIDGELDVSWHVLSGVFPSGCVEAMFEAYRSLLVELAGPRAWTGPAVVPAPTADLDARRAANTTAGPLPEGLLTDAILDQAARRPEAVAVVAADRTLTFAELAGRAVRLAGTLAAAGVRAGVPVAIGVPKSWRQVVAAVGVLLAGGAYVPVDPDLPAARQEWLVKESGAQLVLVADHDAEDSVNSVGVPVVLIGDDGGDGGDGGNGGGDGGNGDNDWSRSAAAQWRVGAAPDDLAYIVYTSGSTGTPKGVAVTHRAALNTCADIVERFGIGERDRVLGMSSLSFDLSVFDLFGVLGAGGAVVLPEPGTGRDPGSWIRLVREHGVTVWNTVPALAEMLVEHAAGTGSADLPLRLALLSGDWIAVSLPDRLRGVAPGARVISLGGATEAAIWSIAYEVGEVDPEWESIPYGRPLRNQWFEVLDEALEPCPTWVAGELFIGGAGLAEGYWRDEERTAAAFINHPADGRRLYRTGDLGRYLPDGTIQFLGREDFQVKIGGFRIELGEIEAALERHPGVRRAVATAVGDRSHRRLVGYAVPDRERQDAGTFTASLSAHLAESLPSYMIPHDLVVLPELPLTANGKVDRAALPLPTGTAEARTELEPGLRAVADSIAAIVAEVLGRPAVDPWDNFFSLGGDSILGIQVVGRVAAGGLDVTPRDLFTYQNIADLVAGLHAEGRLSAAAPAGAGPVPLTARQRQMFTAEAAACRVVLDATDALDLPRLERAMAVVHARHDALRLNLVGDAQTAAPAEESVYVPEISLDAIPDAHRPAAVARILAEMAEEADPRGGPATKAAVLRLGPGRAQFVWVGHRAAVDQTSWPIVVGDLIAAYRRLGEGGPEDLPGVAPSFLAWAGESAGGPGPAAVCLTDDSSVVQTLFEIPAETAGRLVADLAGAYRMSLSQGIAAALGWALCQDGRLTGVRVVTEHEDASYTGVGCRDLQQRTYRVPDRVVDPAALMTAFKQDGEDGPATAVVRPIGDLGWNPDPEAGLLVPADFVGPQPVAAGPGGETTESCLAEVTAARVAGALRVRIRHLPHGPGAVAAAHLEQRLRAVAEHCAAPGAGALHPSDFPFAGLGAEDLDSLLTSLVSDSSSTEA